MGYVESNLSSDEKVIAKIEHSAAGLIGRCIVFLLFVVVAILLFNIKNLFFKSVSYSVLHSGDSYFAFIYVIAVMIILLGLVIFLDGVVEIKSAQLVLTNKRIFGRRGFIRKVTTDIVLSHVDTIIVNNGFLGALFHFGSIHIVSPAQQNQLSKRALQYGFISNTDEFRKAVLDALEEVKAHEREEQARLIAEATSRSKENHD